MSFASRLSPIAVLLVICCTLVQGKVIYQSEPRRAVVRPDGRISFLAKAGVPIKSCQYWFAPSWSIIDLSAGRDYKATDEYEYFGAGLDKGECGITIKKVSDRNDGIIQNRIKISDASEWILSASTLRVTTIQESRLPAFEINQKRASLTFGDSITLRCNAGVPIDLCHFFLPGGKQLKLDQGINSPSTSKYKYQGRGLQQGDCGVTLYDVDEILNGILVCKVGNYPEATNGRWETDHVNIVTSDTIFQTEPQRAIVRPGGSLTILGESWVPLKKCEFIFSPTWQTINFDAGRRSRSTDDYEYHGSGLENGECGIKLKKVIPGNDGIIQSMVKIEGKSEEIVSATTLRVTDTPKSNLPSFTIKPKRASLSVGDELTVTCNVDQQIDFCHIFLPGGQFLNFEKGRNSDATSRYRYHGLGLHNGHCGVALTDVQESLSGILVCKVGFFPNSVEGVWETDSLNIEVRPRSSLYKKPSTTETPPTPVNVPQQCGLVHVQPVPLVTYGEETQRGQWPWHVAIYKRNGRDWRYICGGTLIGSQAVVTAAHCVTDGASGRVVDRDSILLEVGKYHLAQNVEDIQRKQIQTILVHPTFNRTSFIGDLAVLTLSSRVRFSDFVGVACLWNPDQTDISNVVGQNGYVVGWGFDQTGEPTPQLMMARLPVVTQLACIRSDPTFFSRFTNDKTLCAGLRNGTSVCSGDSGGGMFFPTKNRENEDAWALRGLVSISKANEKRACDTTNYAVFTDIAKYLSWLAPYVDLR